VITMTVTTRRHQRPGATAVEAALVLTITFLFIFGVFEYCRFLFFLEVAENAAREGARYATVNTARSVQVGAMSDVASVQSTTLPQGSTKYYLYDDNLGPATPPSIRGVVNYFMGPAGGCHRVRRPGVPGRREREERRGLERHAVRGRHRRTDHWQLPVHGGQTSWLHRDGAD